MKAINNWNEVKEAGGEIANLPAGGYICEIKRCEEKKNKQNNGTHLEILFDVSRGDYRGWFREDYDAQTREDKFWHGVIRQNVPNESSPKYNTQCGFFKRFTNAIEASNPGYHWDWNEAGLKGKIIGIVFGEVEKESQRGNRYMTTQPSEIVTVDAIEKDTYKVPAPKMLAPQYPSQNVNIPHDLPDITDDLPF